MTTCAALFATMGTVLHKEGHGSRGMTKEDTRKEEDKGEDKEGMEGEVKGEVMEVVVMVMVVGVGHWT